MKTPVRVALIGARGRMGQTIIDLSKDDPKIDIVAQCDLGDAIDPAIKDCDVAIDFSHAGAIDEICRRGFAPPESAGHRNDRTFDRAAPVH